jgi:hypothetical protein
VKILESLDFVVPGHPTSGQQKTITPEVPYSSLSASSFQNRVIAIEQQSQQQQQLL